MRGLPGRKVIGSREAWRHRRRDNRAKREAPAYASASNPQQVLVDAIPIDAIPIDAGSANACL